MDTAITLARCRNRVPHTQIKLMKQNRLVILRRPGFGVAVESRRVTPCLPALGGIVVCAIILCFLTPARADDASPAKEPGDQATQAQQTAYLPEAYQMKRYQAFARQAKLPSITVADQTSLEVGGAVKLNLKRLAQLSDGEKEALAGQFGVPAEVIGKLLERAAINPPPNAAQLAQAIRTTVIDYRFLQGEWGRYTPPPEGRQVKTNALLALETGDLSKAWQLYDGLRKPQAPSIGAPPPPTNLRVVAQP